MNDNQEKIDLALDLLEKFNRKERYHLLCDAVVGSPFSLQDSFLEKINDKLEDHPIPRKGHVYVAMDYHIDWIASVLHLVETDEPTAARAIRDENERVSEYLPNELFTTEVGSDTESEVITGNQSDVDLLIAYCSEGKLVLVLVEAKLESGWGGDQLEKKGRRLEKILGRKRPSGWILPRFVLAGPGAESRAPNFWDKTLAKCPDWFFSEPQPEQETDRTRAQLRRINLFARHALYQPTRVSDEGAEWLIKKTWPK